METSNFLNETALSTDETEPIVVVCAADNNYAMPLAVTIRSAMENFNSSRNILLFIIDGGITENNKRRFLKSVCSKQLEIKWLQKPEALIDKEVIPNHLYVDSGVSHISITGLYRLLIPELLPKKLKKAIYIDCDVVVTGNLETLWNIDIKNNYLLAVARLERLKQYTVPFFLRNWQELGFSEDSKYFNSGILVFNLEKWRSDNMCAKSLAYIADNQQYIRQGDQDILNAIVGDNWGELDPRWNCMDPPSMTKEEVKDSFIIHFALPTKPWFALDRYPARDEFYYYLNLTDWSGYQSNLQQRLWRKLKKRIKKQ